MRPLILSLIFAMYCFDVNAQRFKLSTEKNNGAIELYASNEEPYPVSMNLTLKLMNMEFSGGNQTIFIIPPNSPHLFVGKLTGLPGRGTSFAYNEKHVMGDVTAKPDMNYVYDLPLPNGKSYNLTQGYNGRSSHRNENSLDFTMPEGTEVPAARGGTVVEVIQNNNISCDREECKKLNNYVIILHEDGSYATYVHIRFNGAKVSISDVVKAGQMIAYSGKVGYATGPHLHFSCFVAGFDGRRTLQKKFKLDGQRSGYLVEGDNYTRNY